MLFTSLFVQFKRLIKGSCRESRRAHITLLNVRSNSFYQSGKSLYDSAKDFFGSTSSTKDNNDSYSESTEKCQDVEMPAYENESYEEPMVDPFHDSHRMSVEDDRHVHFN
jgi:hypothetical protein